MTCKSFQIVAFWSALNKSVKSRTVEVSEMPSIGATHQHIDCAGCG